MSDAEIDGQKYKKDTRIACKYGAKCYQKNSAHLEKYKHPPRKKVEKEVPSLKRRRVESINDEKTENESRIEISQDIKIDSPPSENTAINQAFESKLSTGTSDEETEGTNTKTIQEDEKVKKFPSSCEGIVESNEENESHASADDTPCSSSSDTSLGRTSKEFEVKQFIKQKFLVEMPNDFYQFWDFCKSVNVKNPSNALRDIDLSLVGPFDVLAGHFFDVPEKSDEEYLIHWRYYYDPPEFQTVLKGSDKTGFHIGYFRDSPDEMPVFLASNHSKMNGELRIAGENIFAAVIIYLEEFKKLGDPFKKIAIERIQKKLRQKAEELNLDLREKTPNIRERDKKIVTRSFNKIGIVVPYNRRTQVGYRDLGVSNKEFCALLNKIKGALPEQQKKIFSELQNILTAVSIATDECDFGTGLELGLDILASGVDSLNSTALRYLATSYRLLQREAFAKIAEAHLKNRRKGVCLSIL